MTPPTHLALGSAIGELAAGEPWRVAFEDAGATVGLYMPTGYDGQSPHDRDEVYVVIAGSGSFRCGETAHDFAAGDLLHVPAHVHHRFERFDLGFAAWVIFYGPVRPPPA